LEGGGEKKTSGRYIEFPEKKHLSADGLVLLPSKLVPNVV
jgi:hypothetical protein